MNCPYCNRPMTEGILESNRNLYFRPGPVKPHVFLIGGGAVSLGSFWTAFEVKTFYCETCDFFLFKNPKPASEKKSKGRTKKRNRFE